MKTLEKIGREHGTLKSSLCHGFLGFYDEQLSALREQPIKLLELGVAHGQSLAMWRDFFALGEVHGVDQRLPPRFDPGDRIKLHKLNIDVEDKLSELAIKHGPWDVIVDDAAHNMKQQQRALATLWDTLAPGGIYIVEDLHTSFSAGHNPTNAATTYDLLRAIEHGKPLPDKSFLLAEEWARISGQVESVEIYIGPMLHDKGAMQAMRAPTSRLTINHSITSVVRKKL